MDIKEEEWHDLYEKTVVLTNKYNNKQAMLQARQKGATTTNKKLTDQAKIQSSKNRKLEEHNDAGKHEKVDVKIGKLIQKVRLEKGKSQQELAKSLNIKTSVIQEIESGKAKLDNQLLSKIKRKLNITKDTLKNFKK